MAVLFKDRADAGRRLAELLSGLAGEPCVVLGIPRGGVPVAARVAAALGAPLDVLVVRKIAAPLRPELALGAVGEGGVMVLDDDLVVRSGLTAEGLDEIERVARAEVEDRAGRWRVGRPAEPLDGRTAVVVDDGLATGATAVVGCRLARLRGASRVVLAVPVAPRGWRSDVADVADEAVCVAEPRRFRAVGAFYADFTQTSDAEVAALLG